MEVCFEGMNPYQEFMVSSLKKLWYQYFETSPDLEYYSLHQRKIPHSKIYERWNVLISSIKSKIGNCKGMEWKQDQSGILKI